MNNTITEERINKIMDGAKINVETVFDKMTVVTAQLENGFCITEASGAVDKDNYDEKIGTEICIDRIRNKLWELEGYKLQCEIYELETFWSDKLDRRVLW